MEDFQSSRNGIDQALVKNTCIFDTFTSLSSSAKNLDWEEQLQNVMKKIGFKSYLISLGRAVPSRDPLSQIITTYPVEWLDRYSAEDLFKIDPIVKHCNKFIIPMFWERERLLARGSPVEFWAAREEYGLKYGISIPLRYKDMTGSLSVAQEANVSNGFEGDVDGSIGDLFMLLPYLVEGLKNRIEVVNSPKCKLTKRESECLEWSAFGKTSWEISCILNCAERTVNFHIGNATLKLGALNRRQAIASAITAGYITI